MKMFKILIIFCLLNINAYAYSGFSVCNYGKQTVDSVICYSPTVLKETTVKGDIKVTGTLRAENISTRGLQVEGNANLRNAYVGGATIIRGDLFAETVEFKRGIAIEGEDTTLNNSKVNGMVTITSKVKQPFLHLSCGSVVTGAVLFDGKAGVIEITGDSLVQGKIINGAMQFVKTDCKGVK